MKTHKVIGGGGVQLHVVETGNPLGRPILFLHGVSQCWLSWDRQLNSTLAQKHRLVAMDLRGHGLSDKPRDAYQDARLWADDVHAVIQTLSLDHPVLCGWSYGPLVFLDYLRHYGEDAIGGLHWVGGVTKLGSEDALAVLTPEFLAIVPAFFSTDTETTVHGMDTLLRLCFSPEPSAPEKLLMLGYNLAVPPYVRQGMFSRVLNNDDLLGKITKPVLITQGDADAVVKPSILDQHKAAMPHAQIHLMRDTAHAAFWTDAAAFNNRLHAFCDSLDTHPSPALAATLDA
jgi:pimeloyl-ACP methyl ester carboxylesterase